MLDKTGQTGSPLQFVNGLILIITFAGARLVYGSIMVLYIRGPPPYFQSSFARLTDDYLLPCPFPPTTDIPGAPDTLRGARRPLKRRPRRVRVRVYGSKWTKCILVRPTRHQKDVSRRAKRF